MSRPMRSVETHTRVVAELIQPRPVTTLPLADAASRPQIRRRHQLIHKS